ncbi:MAG: Maf family protein [Candidatus Omnitrophica bacterium]|nr:Maf family protein [Candidatus Omnitrophota bacterium]
MGADTVVVFKEHILGKPKNKKDAVRMLTILSGRTHSVFTGVSILDRKHHSLITGYARTDVFFKKLSAKAILDYIEKVHVLDKAGAYAIQEGPKIAANIKGSYSNVVGLPTELLRSMLKEIS